MPVVIRLAREADAEGVLAIYGPYVRDTAISFEVEPPVPEEFRQRIRTTLAHGCWLVCERGGSVAGYAYGGRFHPRAAYQWTVEVTVYVHPDHQRRGVGLGLYTALLEVLRLQGFHSAVGIITLPNPASLGLHERLSFRPAGVLHAVGYKHGCWHDVGWWQRALQEGGPAPDVPRPVQDLVGTPPWQGALGSGVRLVRAD
jgi:phosphinothricin acetyltransferase